MCNISDKMQDCLAEDIENVYIQLITLTGELKNKIKGIENYWKLLNERRK